MGEGNRIKKIITLTLLCFLFSLFAMDSIQAESRSIQQMIDDAQPGETLNIREGIYDEKLVIHKPIRLVGSEGVILTYQGSDPIITINSNDVVIENLNLHYTNDDRNAATILVQGDFNVLQQINIQTNSYGIYLDESNHNKLTNIVIHGMPEELFRDRRHGIHVWKSHNNEIEHSQIKYVQDGIYVERSHENKIVNNVVSQSRYGFHLMFTTKTLLQSNESYDNVSGMMIMGTEGTVAKQNTLAHNRENLQSLGLLLFDVTGATISENHMLYNRIGIFIEGSQDNELRLNNVQGNYIGLQFKKAHNNYITHNSFIANVSQGQAEESSNNHTDGNYWGDHRGLDLSGDRTSDLIYSVDSFFLKLTYEYPPFQLLFQSPGMIFLQQLVHMPIEHQLIDQAPLMDNPIAWGDDMTSAKPIQVLMFSVCLLIISLTTIYLGVRTK